MHTYTVVMGHDRGTIRIETVAKDGETAAAIVCEFEGAPRSAVGAVYRADVCPRVNSQYGAPMGRADNAMDHDSPRKKWRARAVRLDAYGYDKGGAYWGHRFWPLRLYAVQDGQGNLSYIDATSSKEAIAHFLD